MKRKILLPILLGLSISLLSGCTTHPKGLETDLVSIPCYKGINTPSIEAENVDATDVENQVQNLVDAQQVQTDVTDREVLDGDLVTVTYTAVVDGLPFDGANSRVLVAGSDGISEGLLGHFTGETYQWDCPIPDTYPDANFWGKTAVYTVTIERIQAAGNPIDPADEAGSFQTLEKEQKKSLEAGREALAESEARDRVWTDLVRSVTVKEYPEDRVAAMRDAALENARGQAAFENLSYEEWLSKYHYGSHEAFAAHAEEAAKSSLTEVLTAEAILEQEHIKVSQKDYDNWMDEDFRTALEKNHSEEELWNMLRIETAKGWVFDHCNEIDMNE